MAIEIRYTGQVVTVVDKRSTVTARSPSYSVGVVSGLLSGGVPYEGAYEADALFREQVFATRSKTMRDDFTVHAINYTEAPNDSGITVTIGG